MIDFEFDTRVLSDSPHDPLPESHAQESPTRLADELDAIAKTRDDATLEQMFVEALAADLRLSVWQQFQIWCAVRWPRLIKPFAAA